MFIFLPDNLNEVQFTHMDVINGKACKTAVLPKFSDTYVTYPYFNQGGQIMPNHWLCLPKKLSDYTSAIKEHFVFKVAQTRARKLKLEQQTLKFSYIFILMTKMKICHCCSNLKGFVTQVFATASASNS